MQSPYFVSVDPSASKLAMFFGRRQELGDIRHYVLSGDSVLLIGERRIGKTFLLYLLNNLPQAGKFLYKRMMDRETAGVLFDFYISTRAYLWPYVDLLVITNSAGFYFNILCQLDGMQIERYKTIEPIDHAMFVNEMARLSQTLSSNGQRAVVLIDEVEKLLEMVDCGPVISSLKGVMQRCDAIDFILAGDVKPHQETREFANLRGATRSVYLGPIAMHDAQALVQLPVEGQAVFDDQAMARILELTGCKPSLIQIMCDHLCGYIPSDRATVLTITGPDLDQMWESELRDRVFESFGAPLREFFEGLQGDEQAVFVFLAHRPLSTAAEISAALGIQPATARRSLRSLETSHRIMRTGSKYRLSALIVEEFGRESIACPSLQPSSAAAEQEDSPLRKRVWASIEVVERAIRDLIVAVYEQSGTSDLEGTLERRHAALFAHWVERRARGKGAFKHYEKAKQAEETILCYSTLGELGQVIIKDWDFFRDKLKPGRGDGRSDKRFVTEALEGITKVRDALAHHRYAPERELMRAEVYCADILQALEAQQAAG